MGRSTVQVSSSLTFLNLSSETVSKSRPHLYYPSGGQIKVNEMDGACSTNRCDEKCIQTF
jgi:hypothetical protein